MPTPLHALRYPTLADPPSGPQAAQNLADDVDGWLTRAFPCLSSARPASPLDGRLIRETDTGMFLGWDGTEWVPLGTSGGGGGAGAYAQFSGTAQSVANATDVVCAFPTTDTASALVTRAARGAGHEFALGGSSPWIITATIRYATTSATGERYAGIHTGAGAGSPLAGAGQAPTANNPATINLTVPRYFAAGSTVFVNLYQGTGGTRTLEPHASGGWVRLNFAQLT